MSSPTTPLLADSPFTTAAGLAFDGMAATYDATFTESQIGRAQRDRVWRRLARVFRSGDKILELNCGTGEDALFLARRGASVYACDASAAMVSTANSRIATEAEQAAITFHNLPTEQIEVLEEKAPFDGVLSNFSGLNCVDDLKTTATTLAKLVRPGAQLMLCFSTRYCLSEIAYYLLRGKWRKAFRRCGGSTMTCIGGQVFVVHYPTLAQLQALFAPHFTLRSCEGIGVAIPPSYLESWAARHRRVFRLLCSLERILAPLPFFRVTGDHMLLHFVREGA